MSPRNLLRWSGMACILSGLLFLVGAIVHPSQETPLTILRFETNLVAGHWLFTFSLAFLLLGLSGMYAAQSERAGRLGLISFLMVFFGSVFFAVSNDYGFIAPVLAAHAPEMLDAINAYPSVIAMNVLLAVGFLLGFILFGIATLRAGVFPRPVGLFLSTGTPLYLIGAGLALTISPSLWGVVILGSLMFGAGLVWAGYWLWTGRAARQRDGVTA